MPTRRSGMLPNHDPVPYNASYDIVIVADEANLKRLGSPLIY